MSTFSKLIEDNLDWVLKGIAEANLLLLDKSVHWVAKNQWIDLSFL